MCQLPKFKYLRFYGDQELEYRFQYSQIYSNDPLIRRRKHDQLMLSSFLRPHPLPYLPSTCEWTCSICPNRVLTSSWMRLFCRSIRSDLDARPSSFIAIRASVTARRD